MPKYEVPRDRVLEILRQNDLDPDRFAVEHVSDTMIVLLNYKTRCQLVLHQGDKKWQ